MPNSKTILSGIQPSGAPHIGNYFGAMKQFVDLQDKHDDMKIFIAEYHAMTTIQDADRLRELIFNLAVDYLAIGLDPEKVTLYRQSAVPEVHELTWIFNCLVSVPFLERAVAYKDKIAKGKKPSVGLFDYPVLQAADILLPDADVVPVGADQKQHIEYARDIAEKFNSQYGEVFTLPKADIKDEVATVPGIDGEKMSKSYGNYIPLFGGDDVLEEKVMSIVTDSQPLDAKKDPEADLVFQMNKLFAPEPELSEIREGYEQGGLGYGESKKRLLENIKAFVTPLREKRAKIANDRDYVLGVLEEGAQTMRPIAEQKIQQVRSAVGLNIS